MAIEATAQSSEVQISPQPPYTNRGAEMTLPPDNRSLIDWAGFTLKISNPKDVVSLLGLDPDLFAPFPFGFSGYRKSLRCGNISVYYEGREDMGCHVEMTGQGCREYEAFFTLNPWVDLFKSVFSAQGKFSRLDLALDNVDGVLSLKKILKALRHGETRSLFSEWRLIRKGVIGQGKNLSGETLYLGSPKSHVLFRIYDKAKQSNLDGFWIRFEIQLRNNRAQEAVRLLADKVSIGTVATGIINNYFAIIHLDDANKSRCSLQRWWADWLQSTEKISLGTAKEQKFVTDTMDFIRRQYAPSLAMIKQHLGPNPFKSYVSELLDDGQERMSAKHERMLSASAPKKKPKLNPGGEHEHE